ncbi:hypothetical protein AVEN_91657-1, partial [Araneus ventricosus]
LDTRALIERRDNKGSVEMFRNSDRKMNHRVGHRPISRGSFRSHGNYAHCHSDAHSECFGFHSNLCNYTLCNVSTDIQYHIDRTAHRRGKAQLETI